MVRDEFVRTEGIRAGRWLIGVLAVAAGAFAMSTPPVAGQTSLVERGSSGGVYVALGDSLTAGTGASPGRDFVDLLFTDYQSTLGVTDLARFGDAGGPSEGRRAEAVAAIRDPSDTRAVTLTMGGGYALQGCDFTSPSCAYRTDFAATLANLQAALANDPGDERLIAIAMYNPWVGESDEARGDRLALGTPVELNCAATGAELGMNDIVAQEAVRHGALVADAYPAFKEHGQAYMSPGNDVHPNDAGYAAIAEAFRNAESPCGPTLDLEAEKQKLRKSLSLSATVDTDSTLVAKGKAIKKTRRQLAANEMTRFHAKLNREAIKELAEELDKRGQSATRVTAAVTSEAGGTATDKVKVRLKD